MPLRRVADPGQSHGRVLTKIKQNLDKLVAV